MLNPSNMYRCVSDSSPQSLRKKSVSDVSAMVVTNRTEGNTKKIDTRHLLRYPSMQTAKLETMTISTENLAQAQLLDRIKALDLAIFKPWVNPFSYTLNFTSYIMNLYLAAKENGGGSRRSSVLSSLLHQYI